MSWPKEVPILIAKDMYKGAMKNATGTKYCLMGWLWYVFAGDSSSGNLVYNKATKKLEDTVDSYDISIYNDSHSHRNNAKVWNKLMRKLGYTKNC